MIADQPQDNLKVQPGGEHPADHDVVQALGDPVVIIDEAPGHFG